ncbi:RICIN domain-containing protein [Streptosporangium sp. CA-135522]|uniref:RICIN domain-containing protein n=1 Tax=Streptosporangium sp. CA-135522 TaxID=3240072 RepID=UPI003D92C39D
MTSLERHWARYRLGVVGVVMLLLTGLLVAPARAVAGVMIVARHSGKCLDVAGYGTANGTNVWQWTCHGGANQRWLFGQVYGDQPYYFIKNVHSNKCLAVSAQGTANGSNVLIWDCVGSSDQRWFLSTTSGGYDKYEPKHASLSKCLDVEGGGVNDPTEVWIWDCLWPYLPSQEWKTVA